MSGDQWAIIVSLLVALVIAWAVGAQDRGGKKAMTPPQERELTAASELTAMLRDLHGHFEQVLATCLPAATAGN